MVGVPRLWESIYEGVQQFREQPTNKQRLINFLWQVVNATFRDCAEVNTRAAHYTKRLIAGIQMVDLWPLHTLAERMVYKRCLRLPVVS